MSRGFRGGLGFLNRHHGENAGLAVVTSLSFVAKFNDAIGFGENGVVFAQADIGSGKIAGSALTDNNHAGFSGLTIVEFDPQILCI